MLQNIQARAAKHVQQMLQNIQTHAMICFFIIFNDNYYFFCLLFMFLTIIVNVVYVFICSNHVNHMTTCCKQKGMVLQNMFTKCCNDMNKAAKHVHQMLQKMNKTAKHVHQMLQKMNKTAKHVHQMLQKHGTMLQLMITKCCKTLRTMLQNMCQMLQNI